MALLDKAGTEAVEKLNKETIPILVGAIAKLVETLDSKFDEDIIKLVDDANDLLDRLNGATVTLTIPPRI